MWSPLASVSLVFLNLYLILFIVLATLFTCKKVEWKSRWLVLLLHVLVRLASQACGLAFGIIGNSNINILVAYLVLGAEGYFTLVVCVARFLIAWQRLHWSGYSWIEPIDPTKEQRGWKERIKRLFQVKPRNKAVAATLSVAVDWLLIATNAILVAGGSLSSAAYTHRGLPQNEVNPKLDAAKAMRAAEQAVFLVVNTLLLVCIAVTLHQHRHYRYDNFTEQESKTSSTENVRAQPSEQSKPRPWYAHPTLLLLLVTWPCLAVRGGFGVAQALLPNLSYFNAEVYDTNNLTHQFVTDETCFVTMMEFISAAILTCTYFTGRPGQQHAQASSASNV